MQTLHTAAIHHLLGTPVRLDLGSTTGALIDISKQVGKLDRVSADTEALPERFTALDAHVSAQVQQLKTEFQLALDAAADDIVQRVSTPVDTEPEDFDIGATAVPLVRLLVQAQALAIVREPGTTDDRGDENAAMRTLSNAAKKLVKPHAEADKDLFDRYIDAFAPFTSPELEYRSERFVEMHALVELIALHFDSE